MSDPTNKSSDGKNNTKVPPHKDLTVTLPLFHGWREKAGAGVQQKPPELARSRSSVSVPDHNTASSFLFLFSVLLAKQHNVYTSGYYICQNNYAMTNGTSMQSINPAQTGILYPRLPLIPSRVSGVPCVSNHDNPGDARWRWHLAGRDWESSAGHWDFTFGAGTAALGWDIGYGGWDIGYGIWGVPLCEGNQDQAGAQSQFGDTGRSCSGWWHSPGHGRQLP